MGSLIGKVAYVKSNSAFLTQFGTSAAKALQIGIDDVPGELALVYQPTTANQTVSGTMIFIEY